MGKVGDTKGHKSREIPMGPELTKALKAYPRRIGCPWVLHKQPNKNPDATPVRYGKDPQRIGTASLRVLGRAIGWHTLRHTFCSHLALKGASVHVIKDLAGHSAIVTTMGYMHLADSSKREAIALLG